MEFEWDEAKNRANIAKHGISFGEASGIFDGSTYERVDARQDYGETRYTGIGLAGGRELFVVFTWRGRVRRIISARRASRDEG
jgi:uncharacterized DUF497 family protein